MFLQLTQRKNILDVHQQGGGRHVRPPVTAPHRRSRACRPRWTGRRISSATHWASTIASRCRRRQACAEAGRVGAPDHALDRDIDFFIDPFVVAGEARFSWRAATGVASPVLEAFEAKAGPWIGLLRWLRASDGTNSPLQQTLRLSKNSTFEEAIACAESLVQALDFGLVPAERLAERIESRLDIPVLFVDAAIGEASISGATCHLPDLNVILVNRGESEVRRSFDLAHELFHALTWQTMEPEHVEPNDAPAGAAGARGSSSWLTILLRGC